MNNFLIGQYGSFHEPKYQRDYRFGFYGIEACLFEDERDADKLRQAARESGFRIGVHYPLRAGRSPERDAPFLARDEARRSQAYELAEQELAYLYDTIRPAYVLFHYPKPVILDDGADWTGWRFQDRSEYECESAYPLPDFREKSGALFEWLSAKAGQYGFVPVLELDALNRYAYDSDELVRLLERHPSVKLCLDTARLHLQDRIDPRFDAEAAVAKFAPYAGLVHLSNSLVSPGGSVLRSRVPVLPDQSPADGWAPIERYLGLVRRHRPDALILFEHRSELVSDEELDACYRWVDALWRQSAV